MTFRSGQSGNVVLKGQMWHGRYYVDVPGEGKRRRTSVPLGSIRSMKKNEAKRKLRRMLEEMGLNSDQHLEKVIRGGRTFAQEAAWWREHRLSKCKPSTQEAMGGHLDKYLIPELGTMALEAIDERRVQEFITLLETKKHRWPNGVTRKLSQKTIRNIIGVLKLVLGKKVWRNWNLTFPEDLDPDKEQRYFTPEEMLKIVNAASGQWKVLFALLAGTGMRVGEAIGLEIEDLDLAAGMLRIRRSIWKGQAFTPKTKRAKRPIYIEPALAEMLSTHLMGRTTGRVFQTAGMKPHSRHNVYRKLRLLLKKLCLKAGGIHAFRHGRVSMLRAAGVPDDLVIEQVGHSNLDTTKGYTHFTEEFRSRVARATGLFSREDSPNSPNFREFHSTGRIM